MLGSTSGTLGEEGSDTGGRPGKPGPSVRPSSACRSRSKGPLSLTIRVHSVARVPCHASGVGGGGGAEALSSTARMGGGMVFDEPDEPARHARAGWQGGGLPSKNARTFHLYHFATCTRIPHARCERKIANAQSHVAQEGTPELPL